MTDLPQSEKSVQQLIDTIDWSESPLGAPSTWSPSLCTTVGLMLGAAAEIVLFWGPEFAALYNDAYAPTIGSKHPCALGRPAREGWAELWDDLGPLLEGVRTTGKTFVAKDRPFYIERHGYGETVYFDISYSAVPDPDGSVGGVLCIVAETTGRVLAERRIRQSESRLRALVNATADMVYRMSPDWSELRQLDGRSMLADVDSPTIRWMDDFLLPEDRPLVQAAYDKAIANLEPFQVEVRVRQADGSIGWVFSRAVPILDENGAIAEWFGAASDITERRRASEQLTLVVHELNHRVKNNLAMVQAIAMQTFRGADDIGSAQRRFGERLVALAQANDLLTGERWTGASLRGAIAQAVEPHQSDTARLALAGPDLSVSPKTALALTLAMHELATNALKYGAWSNDSGRVIVRWAVEGDRLRIEWREEGGPPVADPTRRGFGSQLIKRGLAGEMDAEVTLDFASSGFGCVVDAPVANNVQE